MTREKWPRGRPKDDAKKTALLDAARSLLLARGPDVTIDEIAASAGIAKATVYANFAGKNALIEAVIRRESDMTITAEQLARLDDRTTLGSGTSVSVRVEHGGRRISKK